MGQQSGQKSIIPAEFLSYYRFLASVSPILQIEFIKILNYMKKAEEGDVCRFHYIIRPTRKAEPLSKAHDSLAVRSFLQNKPGGGGRPQRREAVLMEPGFANPLSCQNYLMRKGDCIIPPTLYLPRAQRTCPVLYAEEGGRAPKGPQTWSGGVGGRPFLPAGVSFYEIPITGGG